MQKTKAPKPRTIKTTTPKWKGRTADTHAQHVAQLKDTNLPPYEICLLGDSITEHWKDYGKASWEGSTLSTKWKIFNAGVGGDMTQNVLWRLAEGLFSASGLKPRLVILLIGANNVRDDSDSHIVAGIEAICDMISKDLPSAKIVVCSILPIREEKQNAVARSVNAQLDALSKESKTPKWHFHSFTSLFEEKPGGAAIAELYGDHIHLSEKGYERWAPALVKLIQDSLQ